MNSIAIIVDNESCTTILSIHLRLYHSVGILTLMIVRIIEELKFLTSKSQMQVLVQYDKIVQDVVILRIFS